MSYLLGVSVMADRGADWPKLAIVWLAFGLFSVIVVGLFWLAGTPATTVSLALAYAAGLSMIVLPCTLPLVFVIIPLSLKGGYKKGLSMAVLFGLGLSVTLALYGVAFASFGRFLGMDRATHVMFALAGLLALFFGLSELRLVSFALPATGAVPRFVTRQGDHLKSFFMGLFLGNAGVGCPNPAFYALVAYIAATGNPATGAGLGLIHGIGRATPLVFLVILALLGVNATQNVLRWKEKINAATGWALVVVGAFIFNYGLFGHHWWETSVFHRLQNNLVALLAPRLAESQESANLAGIPYRPSEVELYFPQAPWLVFGAIVLIACAWARLKAKFTGGRVADA